MNGALASGVRAAEEIVSRVRDTRPSKSLLRKPGTMPLTSPQREDGAMADQPNGATGQDGKQPVVHFTDAARQKIVELLTSKGYHGTGALRITVKNPGAWAPDYGMALEENGTPGPGDVVISAEGFNVLTDEQSLAQVDGARVDFFDQLLQRGFKVDAPPPPPAPPSTPPRSTCPTRRSPPSTTSSSTRSTRASPHMAARRR